MPERETLRVEAFSDGVFAIAMTLLILEIKVPPAAPPGQGNRWLAVELARLWPSFLAYALSFGTVLIMWVNHHGLFRHAHLANNRLLFANGFLLLSVTFVPFPTAVLAAYLNKPASNAAAVLYCSTFVAISIGYNLLLWAVRHSRAAEHIGSPPHEAAMSRIARAYLLGLFLYLAATIVSIFSAPAGVAICFFLWVLWVVLNYAPGKAPIAAP